ncbi:hypothetical protein PANT_22c00131 [Moesziomyces antarcticus T-34]|uniref:Uncharacterized protein n=1 Tax=Pseudozyma antarctica (strain T-34) TaxID=1151754 RepID=M9LZW0_PSEA3|nr:hypothetical protein PANT_22c00131 [Moesziomyces antarcticus T-34]
MATLGASDKNAGASPEASTSYQARLPDKKTFIATLSGGAFVVGLTGATIYGLRKARLQAIKEAEELAKAAATSGQLPGAAPARVPASLSPHSLARAESAAPVEQASASEAHAEAEAPASQGAFALFRQMNSAILNPTQRAAGTAAPTSVFDDETGALPSVLRRKRSPAASSASSTITRAPTAEQAPRMAAATASSTTLTHPSDTKIDYSEMDSTLDFLGLSSPVPADEQRRMKALEEEASRESGPTGFFQSPVGLSLKAFFIATSIVSFTTLAGVEVAKRALGVETMDEFVVAMTRIVPSRQKGEASLKGVAPHMHVTRDAADLPSSGHHMSEPKSVDEALTDLSRAGSFEEWVSTLKRQLDSERDFEVQRRFAGASAATNDSISTSERMYAVHSPLEDVERDTGTPSMLRSVLAISPVLPSTAFGLGLVSGVLTAGKRAGLVFMAENAHRLPDTVQGWYFYSKTKNYKVMLGAAKGGLKQGVRLGIWTTGFCLAERVAELTRGAVQSHFRSTPAMDVQRKFKILGHWTDGALAGVVTAAAATTLYRLPRPAAVRVFQLGLLAGAGTGALRDVQERLVHKEIGGVASHT